MLTDYGWSPELQQHFDIHATGGLAPGRIIAQHRGGYRLICETGEISARAASALMDAPEAERPAVGDWAAFEPRPGETLGLVRAILPRSSAFVRKASGPRGGAQVVAANVDLALLVAAMNADFNPRRLERYLATAHESGASPVIVLTKADLAETPDGVEAEARRIAFEVPVLSTSVRTGLGLDHLAGLLGAGRTAVLLGSSGAGKSSLVNALAGSEIMSTGEIRESDARGRHTTTHRELLRLPTGALLIDTPGMRELGLWEAEAGVGAAFADLEALAAGCRFSDCRHRGEPGCAVRAAIEAGDLLADRLHAFEKLQAELAFERRKEDPREAAANKRLWAGRHKAARAWIKQKRDFGED